MKAFFLVHDLIELKVRGVHDIQIACPDNLTDFTKTIRKIFSQTVTQHCVVHQIHNSYKYVAWKEKKGFMADLKRMLPSMRSRHFSVKWGKKYGYVITSWMNNWDASLYPFLHKT